MKGCLGGLKTLIQKENPQAYYVHCFAHQFQLALVSIVRCHVDANSFFGEVTRIINLIRSSNKRTSLLRRQQAAHLAELVENDMVETGTGLNQELYLARAGDTRWGSHFRVLLRLKKLFTPVVEVLEELKYNRAASEAKGLLLLMKQFDFAFMLHLMTYILGVTDELSQALQRSDQDLLNALQLVEVNKKMFQRMRDDGWEEFFEKVSLSCGNLGINVPDMKSRYVKDSRSQRNAPFIAYLHYFKYDCFVHIIDVILKDLNERFTPESTELLQCVACLSPCSSFEAFDTKSLVRMARLYPKDFAGVEDEELVAQLEVYIRCIRTDANFSNLKGLSDLCKTLVRTKKHKTFRFVYKLVEVALTLPISTASVERVFFKNELQKEVFSTVDDRDIINRFQAMKKRRMTIKL
ncbi:hypothetical protein LIER_38511 [Lithospermum erythrorhizon]|uniref:HAT C-terminal dimerisation domain-containing protein n=1 Tax=Lithospermum erythrorhizon TaxID=34254 RepID=A0AAV3Q5K2_LITER